MTQLSEPLRLHDLTFLPDGDDVVVGRVDIDSYGVFPPDGAALLQQLVAGVPPHAAADWYARTYGEPVDLDEFLGVLTELEFTAQDEVIADPKPPRWQRLGRWLFSPVGWVCHGLLLAAAAVAMASTPELIPRVANLFYTDYTTAIALTFFLGQFPLILVHESFHALAGRRLGLHSRLRISRRLYFVVFETSLDGLVVFPRRRRYLPILAGMLADLLVIAVLTLVAAATLGPDGKVGLLGAICLALAFATFLRFLWQFYFHLQTDLYVVAVTVLGCQDLQAAARRILRDRFRRLAGRPGLDLTGLHPRDREVGRWYSWLLLFGYVLTTATLLLFGVPALWRLLTMLWHGLTAGDGGQVLDSVVFLTLMLGQFALAGYLAMRARRLRPAAPTHLTS
ncbi:hypothetical protein QEZ54_09910 [Catellatospora sp. KI3]|uniref:hypothetical protein n=1 Tax=Catellatospora sp. KI3 TaxID=3041620 RepID=UPI002482BEC5|nr:hypothetical protein [Catellatospora sp. KI3]MDI1461282.1 hypothetical protein [Catellatospora sp. KI3]